MERRFDSPRNRTLRSAPLAAGLACLTCAAGVAWAGPIADSTVPATVAETTGSFWVRPEIPAQPLDVRFQSLSLGGAVRFVTMNRTNVILAPGVDRKLSLDLRSVSEGEALDHLLQRENIGARFEGNTVFLGATEQRQYELPIVLKSEETFWPEIESGIGQLRSGEGIVAISKSSGLLSIEDTPAHLERMEAHLHRILRSVLRQVEIEVKVLEAVLADERGAGVDWSAFSGVLDPAWGLAGGATGGSVGFQSVADSRQLFQVGILKPGKWRAFVDAFDEEITLNLIASPRITALSNQPANFEVKERIPYLTKTVTADQGVTVTEFQLAFDEAGIRVAVVASVSEGGMVTLDVHPKVSSVTGFTQSLPDLGAQPIIDSRETRSTVRLADGHSLVMSGLMQDRENRTVTGVPVLSRIPLLGRAFRAERLQTEKTEIVVVLTPRLRQEPAVGTLARYDRVQPVAEPLAASQVAEELALFRSERAWERFVTGDPAGSLSQAQSAARAAPSAWWALNNLGLAQREMGLVALAEQTLRRACRAVDPAPAAALVNLGTLVLHRGHPGEAAGLFEEAAGRATPGPVRTEAMLGLALALEASGRPEDAVEVLQRVGSAGVAGDRAAARLRRLGTAELSRAD